MNCSGRIVRADELFAGRIVLFPEKSQKIEKVEKMIEKSRKNN
jgi:hypothetical protein